MFLTVSPLEKFVGMKWVVLLIVTGLFHGVCMFIKFLFKKVVEIILELLQPVVRNGLMNIQVTCAVGDVPPVKGVEPALLDR